jgi:hypothetical protein
MFLGFNSLLSQQAAGNLTQERLKEPAKIVETLSVNSRCSRVYQKK